MKNDAETLCYQVEKQLSELKEKMTSTEAEELKKKMQDVRGLIGGDIDDPEEVKAKVKDLQELSWKITQQAYQQASSEGSAEEGQEEPKADGKAEEKEKK